ncbi:poly(A) polymerase I-like isoform X1 [Dioscorea cayenensis subsp. rotundata]|uniref:Poly(A) polymerase I-like isoform X1 n=1 Tax=Dioscorea cayennensis subsp. rotundata TaxID=55577 RepID=A0AB40BAN1_DIOCR|nr:poly(A) polymerase I-like isoform X1 [Dioscorea cayenensis subsp. rotundata]
MAIVGISNVTRTSLPFRPPFVLACRRAGRRSSAAALETLPEITHDPVDNGSEIPASSPPPKAKVWEGRGWPEWKMMSSKELGIKASMITKPTKLVLDELKKKGYDVYLVGGCVRDLVMKRTPKDFDIITSAHLSEVKKTFSRCDIVGKRFPICHVHVKDSIVEVSSFCTSGRTPSKGLVYATRSHQDCNEHDYMRWRNCLARDFTINGLMFNPFSNLVYDYMGGMEDIKKAKVRTVIPAYTSFQEDCARILRAIRIAARLGFRFSKETAHSIKDLANSIMRLDKGRLLMEMNYMLAYGSAEASLRLLWKFGLLELLLPIQAAYFVSQGFRRRDKRSNMLLALFSNLDRLLAPDKPCHSCLWVGILAFHQALVKEPRDPLVIATFTLALHNGGDLSEAISIARRINHPHYVSFPELVEARGIDDDEELTKQVQDLACSVNCSLSAMTDEYFVSKAMINYPQAPHSDLVFIPLQVYLKVCRIFECIINRGTEKFFVPKQGNKINYFVLAQGGLAEVRHVFSRVVFDTIYPLKPQDCETST